MKALTTAIILFWISAASVHGAPSPSMSLAPFGSVRILSESAHPAHVVLFLSGSSGWNEECEKVAWEVLPLNSLVVGIDLKSYLGPFRSENGCTYPSADLENLSRFVQQKLGYPEYRQPLILGLSAGGTVVYATLVQSTPNTFLGGISLGFDPADPLVHSVCRGLGVEFEEGVDGHTAALRPADRMETPWTLITGPLDPQRAANRRFIPSMEGAQLVESAAGSHFPAEKEAWSPALHKAFMELVTRERLPEYSGESDLKSLPLIELPAPEGHRLESVLAVIVSGDGGWANIDREIGSYLAAHGIAVVGWNTLKYFWTPRTPDEAAKDLGLILSHYMKLWTKRSIILVGYSFGADVLPFLFNRLPDSLSESVELIALLGPSSDAEFEFHLSDWVGGASQNALPTLPEIRRIKDKRVLCIYGDDEQDNVCSQIDSPHATAWSLPGGHHFGGDYQNIADRILSAVGSRQ